MLFSDANIERPVRKGFRKRVDARAGWPRRCNGNNLVVALGFFDQRIRKHTCITWRLGRALLLLARHDINLGNAVLFVLGVLGWLVALTFLSHHMNENRTRRVIVTDIFQNRHKVIKVMAIDGANIEKP